VKKVKVIGYLKNINTKETYNICDIIGDYKTNDFKYIENDEKTKVEIKIDSTDIIINRYNEQIIMQLRFNKDIIQRGSYTVIDINQSIPLMIITEEINIEENNIYIKYILKNNEQLIGNFEYSINVKEE
jgi:uncharacterized beta-barrel protein YwiB (DUF1934 family)